MASKSKALLFLLAFVLLASTKVTSMEDDEDNIFTETEGRHHHHHHWHAKSPAPAPEPVNHWKHKKTPAPAPVKAKPPVHCPEKAPTRHPPKAAPAYPPRGHHNHGKCVDMCMWYCRSLNLEKGKRACEKACVPCCDHYKCVPNSNIHNNNNNNKCATWDEVQLDGKLIKCPKS